MSEYYRKFKINYLVSKEMKKSVVVFDYNVFFLRHAK